MRIRCIAVTAANLESLCADLKLFEVPTIVVYPKNQLTPSHWGFLADTIAVQTADNTDHCEWFKIWVQEEELQQAQIRTKGGSGVPRSMDELERWYVDYQSNSSREQEH
jgi:hypothetical protein